MSPWTASTPASRGQGATLPRDDFHDSAGWATPDGPAADGRKQKGRSMTRADFEPLWGMSGGVILLIVVIGLFLLSGIRW
jgi:hypothetical protein